MRDWILEHAAKDLPLVMLVIMQGAAFWMLFCASRRPESVIGKMLQDDEGKPSVLRFVTLTSSNVLGWAVMAVVLAQLDSWWLALVVYGSFTCGAHVAVKIGERWDGHLPWSKGPAA